MTLIDCLPEDLVIDILKRLSVKSLLRLKSVCKLWYILIKSPNFISRHYDYCNNHTDLLFIHSVYDDYDHSEVHECHDNVVSVWREETLVRLKHQHFDFKKNGYLQFAGPIDGIILVVNFEKDSYKLDLWNPAIRELRTIMSELDLNLPKNLYLYSTAFGFGLDHLTRDYTVILVQYFFDYKLHTHLDVCSNPALCVPVIRVYKFATDSWNLLDPNVAEIPPSRCHEMSVYLDGSHYWISLSRDRPSTRITAFDTRNQVFRELHVPIRTGSHYVLSVYNDDLALLSCLEDTCTIDVWAMDAEGYWAKKHTIENLPEVYHPLKLWKNNELFYEGTNVDLVSYNIITRETRCTGFRELPYKFRVLEYKESLISVRSQSMKSDRRKLLGTFKDFSINKFPSFIRRGLDLKDKHKSFKISFCCALLLVIYSFSYIFFMFKTRKACS